MKKNILLKNSLGQAQWVLCPSNKYRNRFGHVQNIRTCFLTIETSANILFCFDIIVYQSYPIVLWCGLNLALFDTEIKMVGKS